MTDKAAELAEAVAHDWRSHTEPGVLVTVASLAEALPLASVGPYRVEDMPGPDQWYAEYAAAILAIITAPSFARTHEGGTVRLDWPCVPLAELEAARAEIAAWRDRLEQAVDRMDTAWDLLPADSAFAREGVAQSLWFGMAEARAALDAAKEVAG